jgi:OOP family OmpA-OmpF porin
MTRQIDGRTPEQHAAWNRLHAIIAALLALLLLVLWFIGKGPGFATAGGACCGTAEPVAAEPVSPPPPPDTDGDGVTDDDDRCPNTTQGDRVGPMGCSCDVTVQLQYKFDSAERAPDDLTKLDLVAARLNELQFVGGEVGGYADDTGDDDYNLKLPQTRAESVLAYLESKGVAPGRMTSVGYGEANPIADNATADGKALNRRTVIRRTDCGPP